MATNSNARTFELGGKTFNLDGLYNLLHAFGHLERGVVKNAAGAWMDVNRFFRVVGVLWVLPILAAGITRLIVGNMAESMWLAFGLASSMGLAALALTALIIFSEPAGLFTPEVISALGESAFARKLRIEGTVVTVGEALKALRTHLGWAFGWSALITLGVSGTPIEARWELIPATILLSVGGYFVHSSPILLPRFAKIGIVIAMLLAFGFAWAEEVKAAPTTLGNMGRHRVAAPAPPGPSAPPQILAEHGKAPRLPHGTSMVYVPAGATTGCMVPAYGDEQLSASVINTPETENKITLLKACNTGHEPIPLRAKSGEYEPGVPMYSFMAINGSTEGAYIKVDSW